MSKNVNKNYHGGDGELKPENGKELPNNSKNKK